MCAGAARTFVEDEMDLLVVVIAAFVFTLVLGFLGNR
jgi:hypothetical protein